MESFIRDWQDSILQSVLSMIISENIAKII